MIVYNVVSHHGPPYFIASAWLSVIVQQLCSLFNKSIICTVSPPPMSSCHRILEPCCRGHATIYTIVCVGDIISRAVSTDYKLNDIVDRTE